MNTWQNMAVAGLIALGFAVPLTHYAQALPVHVLNTMQNNLYFEDLFILEEGGHDGCAAHNLERYITYFRQITRTMPGAADAYGMLGFCYFHAGQREKAIAALEQAIARNPYFWGFYYNLGVVYAAQHDFARAQEYFQKAATAPIPAGAVTLSSSKIFNDIIRQSKHKTTDVKERLQQGYALAVAAARLSAYAFTSGQFPGSTPTPRLF